MIFVPLLLAPLSLIGLIMAPLCHMDYGSVMAFSSLLKLGYGLVAPSLWLYYGSLDPLLAHLRLCYGSLAPFWLIYDSVMAR